MKKGDKLTNQPQAIYNHPIWENNLSKDLLDYLHGNIQAFFLY